MSIIKLRALIFRFGRSEDGSSMTEFIIFLPIWIFTFIGIINLGRVGIFSTKVQLRAQRDLWQKSIAVTSQWESIEHQSAIGAAVITAADYIEVSGLDNNDQSGNDLVEAVATGVGMGAYGHFGESAEKAFIPASVAVPSSVRGKYDPEEILGVSSGRYPHLIVNDALASQSFSGGIASIIASTIAASGFVASTAAGIRYGSVFSSFNESTSFISTFGNFSAGAHFDALVSPRAINGAEAEILPFAIAFLMFKTDSKYEEFENFGDENWGGGDGSDSSQIPSTDNSSEVDSGVQAQCDENNASNHGYDPDCTEDCTAKPDWWDTCN